MDLLLASPIALGMALAFLIFFGSVVFVALRKRGKKGIDSPPPVKGMASYQSSDAMKQEEQKEEQKLPAKEESKLKPADAKGDNTSRFKVIFFLTTTTLTVVSIAIGAYLGLQNRQKVTSTASETEMPSPPCPEPGTSLFTGSGSAGNIALGGQADSGYDVESRDGWFMLTSDQLRISFEQEVTVSHAIIYDNDPKSGESPWSVNGVSLPTTESNDWYPDYYPLDIKTQEISIENGGDSMHLALCVAAASPTETPTPTPTGEISITPTPTGEITPSPTVSITPSPTETEAPQCQNIKVYDTETIVSQGEWLELTAADLTSYTAGQSIRLAVVTANTDSVEKARIRIRRWGLSPEPEYTEWFEICAVDTVRETLSDNQCPVNLKPMPAGSDSKEVFMDYELPTGVTKFTVEAEIFENGSWR